MNCCLIPSIVVFLAAWFPLSSFAQANGALPARLVQVSGGEDMPLALELDDALRAITGPVTQCMKRGEPLKTCQCGNLEAVKNMQRVAARVLKQRPQWDAEDVVLYWETRDAEHPIISHNLAIKPMLRAIDATEHACAAGGGR